MPSAAVKRTRPDTRPRPRSRLFGRSSYSRAGCRRRPDAWRCPPAPSPPLISGVKSLTIGAELGSDQVRLQSNISHYCPTGTSSGQCQSQCHAIDDKDGLLFLKIYSCRRGSLRMVIACVSRAKQPTATAVDIGVAAADLVGYREAESSQDLIDIVADEIREPLHSVSVHATKLRD